MQKLQTVNAETLLYEPLEKPSFVVDSLIPVSYTHLLEQAGETPAVTIPYLSADTVIEKDDKRTEDTGEEIQETQADGRSERLKAVFEEAANARCV